MGTDSKIEWTDATWNPIRGCTRISPGCVNCYAERMAARFSDPGEWAHGFAERTPSGPRWTGKLALIHKHLNDPLTWSKPRRIFVNSMSDLFHEDLAVDAVHAVFDVMEQARLHTFQVLTKRADIMRDFVSARVGNRRHLPPNIWLGVSVENQEYARKRIPDLLKTPAAVRFLSCEPLLGPLDFSKVLHEGWPKFNFKPGSIDWVIVGGESGPGARECRVNWIRSIVLQCKAAEAPVFVKQLGAHIIDRNDAGFDGTEPENWPEDTETDDWHEDPARQYQGADARILLASAKGGDMEEWPEDLRVREFPKSRIL